MKAEVADLEGKIDKSWLKTGLPFADWRQCVVTIATVVEDSLRMTGPETADNLKYVLRSLLDLSRLKCVSFLRQPPITAIDEALYGTCQVAMDAADSYESARLAFGCYWNGHARYSNVAGKHLFTSNLCARHEMLDRIVPLHDRGVAMTGNPMQWVVATIIQDGQVDSSGSRISYKFRDSVVRRLAGAMPESRPLLPTDWVAWGHDVRTVRRVLSALLHRCLYHGLAIDTLAGHFGVVGGGLDDLLLRMDWEHLVIQIAKLADVPRTHAGDILGRLRFGESTTNPDPALQPIIPVGRTEIVLPCWTVTTSSVERNFLTLQARVNRKEFDGQSWLFERRMARQIEGVLSRLGLRFRSHLPTQAGETDLIFSSHDGVCVFVVELKWFLPPGDLRETLDRIAAVKHGADQARRKLAALENTGQAISLLDLDRPPTFWKAVVVTEGFSTATDDAYVSCVPSAVFVRLLDSSGMAVELIKWLQEQPWLPVEGTHFQRVSKDHDIGGCSFAWSCHSFLPAADDLAKQWIADSLWQS